MFVPWLETQNGLVVENEMPQGFLRFASVSCASPGMSETRLVCVYGDATAADVDEGRGEPGGRRDSVRMLHVVLLTECPPAGRASA